MQYIYKYNSPLGMLTMSSDGENLTGLWFDGQKYFPSALVSGCEEKRLPVLEETIRWLDIYFSGSNPGFVPSVRLQGTPFQTTVWTILQKIPYGCTVTYGEIAKEVARKKGVASMSAQAVGGAVGHNPASIIVPCHRVIGSSGSMTGYAGGLEKKIALLRLEQAL